MMGSTVLNDDRSCSPQSNVGNLRKDVVLDLQIEPARNQSH